MSSTGAASTAGVTSTTTADSRVLQEGDANRFSATGGESADGSSSSDGEGDSPAYDALRKTHLSFLLDLCGVLLPAIRSAAWAEAQARDKGRSGAGGAAVQDLGWDADAALTAAQGLRLAELLARTRFKPVHFPGLERWPEAYMAHVGSGSGRACTLWQRTLCLTGGD